MGALGYIDGRTVDLKELVIAMEDRGYQFGDGVYEYTKVYNGKCFALKPHIDRLYRSLRELKIPAVFTFDEMADIHERLIAESGIQNGGIYLQITRGWAPRGHAFPDQVIPCLTMTIRPSNFKPEQWETGVGVISVPDERWLRCDIKSLNLLGNVLGKQKAKEAGCYEAIQIRDDKVTEGTSSNFFIVKDGVLWTFPVGNLILKGVTRTLVMEKILPEHDFSALEKAFALDFARKADEAFLSGTTTEIMPVVTIDGRPVGDGKPGPVTRKIQKSYHDMIAQECNLA
jgi:D-alanine transaminase